MFIVYYLHISMSCCFSFPPVFLNFCSLATQTLEVSGILVFAKTKTVNTHIYRSNALTWRRKKNNITECYMIFFA